MSGAAAAKTEVKVLHTPVGVLSYPSLDKPRQQTDDDGKPKGDPMYGATLIFDAEAQRTPQFKGLQEAAIAEAMRFHRLTREEAIAQFKDGSLRTPFRRDCAKKKYAEGCVFIGMRSKNKPQLVLRDMTRVDGNADLTKEQFYPGAYAQATTRPYGYSRNGNKGVGFGLGNMQKVKDGERIDSGSTAEQDFTADLSNAPESVDDIL